MNKRPLCLLLTAALLSAVPSCTDSPDGADQHPVLPSETDETAPSEVERRYYPDSDVLDITDSLEYLGRIGEERWDDSSPANVVSRNPHDMIVFHGKLYVTCGSFQDNTGPVAVYEYSNSTSRGRDTGTLQTEQNDGLYVFDDTLFALSTDQKEWGVSDVYYLPAGEDTFRTSYHLLDECYHCFDMEEYHGSLFFSGAAVDAGGRYKAAVWRVDGSIADAEPSDVTALPLFDAKGADLGYDDAKQAAAARLYELFVFNDTLYGVYHAFSDPDRSGLYRYDEKTGSFVQDTFTDGSVIIDRIFAVTADSSFVSECFTYQGRQYFVTDSITDDTFFATGDLRDFEMIPVGGRVNDVIFRDGVPYILTSAKDEGGWLNAVWTTNDFKTFEKVHQFTSPLYARRFECLDGVYYFGMGMQSIFSTHNISQSIGMPEHCEECGSILRYIPA